MSAVIPSSVLSDLVLKNVSLIPVLNRFGIPLGLGNSTVSEICETYHIDLQFFLCVTNSFLDPGFSGVLTLSREHAHLTMEYLERANQYYAQAQVPNIRIHIISFLKKSVPGKGVSDNIMAILSELEQAVNAFAEKDEKELFPLLRELSRAEELKVDDWALRFDDTETDERFNAAKSIVEDLMQILIRYIKGKFDPNLLHGVIYALSSLRNDLESNTRLRTRIFLPVMTALRSRATYDNDPKQ